MYFLNSYTARKNDQPEETKQEFFINKGKGLTAKEAFNLLSDRFVNKDLTKKKENDIMPGLRLNLMRTVKPKIKTLKYLLRTTALI